MTAGLYEQIKIDLGYLSLNRAAECFATLAEDARAHDWTHIEFLARLVAEESTATRNRRMAARDPAGFSTTPGDVNGLRSGR